MNTSKLAMLEEFHNELKSSNRVSKSMVLSLEEYVGDPVVTSTINPNKLTSAPTPTLTEQVSALVEKAIEKEKTASIEDALTSEDIISALNNKTVITNLTSMISCAYSYEFRTPFKESILIAAMTDESIIYRYRVDSGLNTENTEEVQELIDITKLDISVVIGRYKEYFLDVRKILFGEAANDKEFPDIDMDDTSSFDPVANALLNLIDSTNLYNAVSKQPKAITIRDICQIVANRSLLDDKLYEISQLAGKYCDVNSEYDNDVEATWLAKAFIKLQPSATSNKWLVADIMRYMFVKN